MHACEELAFWGPRGGLLLWGRQRRCRISPASIVALAQQWRDDPLVPHVDVTHVLISRALLTLPPQMHPAMYVLGGTAVLGMAAVFLFALTRREQRQMEEPLGAAPGPEVMARGSGADFR